MPADPDQALPNADFSDLVEWKATQRRRDRADIAAGRRTPEEVQRENSEWLIPAESARRAVFLNLLEACEAL